MQTNKRRFRDSDNYPIYSLLVFCDENICSVCICFYFAIWSFMLYVSLFLFLFQRNLFVVGKNKLLYYPKQIYLFFLCIICKPYNNVTTGIVCVCMLWLYVFLNTFKLGCIFTHYVKLFMLATIDYEN